MNEQTWEFLSSRVVLHCKQASFATVYKQAAYLFLSAFSSFRFSHQVLDNDEFYGYNADKETRPLLATNIRIRISFIG